MPAKEKRVPWQKLPPVKTVVKKRGPATQPLTQKEQFELEAMVEILSDMAFKGKMRPADRQDLEAAADRCDLHQTREDYNSIKEIFETYHS